MIETAIPYALYFAIGIIAAGIGLAFAWVLGVLMGVGYYWGTVFLAALLMLGFSVLNWNACLRVIEHFGDCPAFVAGIHQDLARFVAPSGILVILVGGLGLRKKGPWP